MGVVGEASLIHVTTEAATRLAGDECFSTHDIGARYHHLAQPSNRRNEIVRQRFGIARPPTQNFPSFDPTAIISQCYDRKSVVKGKSGSVSVDIGGRRIIKKKIKNRYKK